MRFIFTKGLLLSLFFLILTGIGLGFWSVGFGNTTEITADSVTVTRMDIEETVRASARVDAKAIARLGFPVGGVIQNVFKEEGETVEEGEIIATLTNGALVAEYDSALQQVKFFQEEKRKLDRGPVTEVRKVARSKVQLAEAELEKVQKEYDQAIENAQRILLTSGITAYPEDIERNDDVPPTVSGNYNCIEEGEYRLELFSSQSQSGRSYHLTGMATGTFEANAINSEPLGDCGLYIKFDELENYKASEWVIPIPNKRDSGYTIRRNTLILLEAEAAASIQLAKEALAVAQEEEQQIIAPAASEDVAQAEANLNEAFARLMAQEARIEDKTIRAPFSGVVSKVDMKIGESVGHDHTITIINEGEYDLVARIPEVDIKKVSAEVFARVTFDAEKAVVYQGRVSFVSPVSINIGGVSYYETYITLESAPDWLREGLNADVEFVINHKKTVPAVPERFLIQEDEQTFVLINNGEGGLERRLVIIEAAGGGLVELSGIETGTKVYLP